MNEELWCCHAQTAKGLLSVTMAGTTGVGRQPFHLRADLFGGCSRGTEWWGRGQRPGTCAQGGRGGLPRTRRAYPSGSRRKIGHMLALPGPDWTIASGLRMRREGFKGCLLVSALPLLTRRCRLSGAMACCLSPRPVG